jgi:hypothetical protein
MRREDGASDRPGAGRPDVSGGTPHFDFFFCPVGADGGWT